MNPQQMAVQVQQLKMMNLALQQEKVQLLNLVERTRAAFEKDKIMELLIANAVTGYASQPRAAELCFYQKDPGTGIMAPVTGGPVWVAEMAFATMQEVIGQLEKMAVAADERGRIEAEANGTTDAGVRDGTSPQENVEDGSGDGPGVDSTVSPSGLITVPA